MKILRWSFFPISLLYGLIMLIRNWAFNVGLIPQYKSSLKVIAVGNLSTGGTGKTPFTEFLIEKLKERSLAILSRGYGRKTSGFILATSNDSAQTIGDEPFQMFRKYQNNVAVAVAEKRADGLKKIEQLDKKINLVVLDDAFQHRYVKRELDILLTSFHEMFTEDFMLPTGNLREPKVVVKRADIVVVTKCPSSISQAEKSNISKRISRYVSLENIFFSTIQYSKPHEFNAVNPLLETKTVYVLTGIANPQPMIDHIGKSSILEHFKYPDHHAFSSSDLDELLVKVSEKKAPVITTEKDMVRLLEFSDHEIFEILPFYYLPISFKLDREEDFLNRLMISIKEVKN